MTSTSVLRTDEPFQQETKNEDRSWVTLIERARIALANGVEVRVSPSRIRRMEDQPRAYFNPGALSRLSESMKAIGQVTPGIIRCIEPANDIDYELVDGERRWRAAIMADMEYRALLIDLDDDAVPFLVAAVANFNREGHTPTEVADSVHRMRGLGIPMEEVARILGISANWATQMHGLKRLVPDVWAMLDPELPKDKVLPVSAAVRISGLAPELQLPLATKVLTKSVSLGSLRSEAVRMTKAAGLPVREYKRRPDKLIRSVNNQMEVARRALENVQHMLASEHASEAFKERARHEVWTLSNSFQPLKDAIVRSEASLNKLRPDCFQ